MSRTLAEFLVKDRIIPQAQFDEAEQAVAANRGSYVRFLIEKRYVSETKLLYYLSQKFGLPSINLQKFEIKREVIENTSPSLVKKAQAIPIQNNHGTMVVAVADPTNMQGLEDLKFHFKMNVEPVLTTYSAFDAAMQKYFGGAAFVGAAIQDFHKEAEKSKEKDDEALSIEIAEVHEVDLGGDGDAGPVITLVNGILSESINRGASDIHIEPYEKRFRVRMRVDGVLIEVAQIPMEMKRAVLSRVKIMSRMDISESRIPQDGRIKLKIGGNEIDFRVNTLPTLFGEKAVLRLLAKGNLQLDLKKLGFEAKQLELFQKGITAPNGLVLVTGPTGSGKTTTLYSALAELNDIQDNISTAEDPVEYNLEGINQVQINKDVGLTFASVLRALLRQDPDTILVGEIRDYETAETAVQAALTGHLVLSTLHTNDTTSTITRLMNMGLEPFLVTASVNTIVAQRLLRRLCKCKKESVVPEEKLLSLGFSKESISKVKIYEPGGCRSCGDTGYKGRVAIYEVLDFTGELKEAVLQGATAIELKKIAMKNGLKTLRMSGLTKMAEGVTSMEEAILSTSEG